MDGFRKLDEELLHHGHVIDLYRDNPPEEEPIGELTDALRVWLS